MEKPVFLIGFMGSGKTTWGKKLANTMGCSFVDMDQEIIKKTGISITDFFNSYGEESFRAIERSVLHEQEEKYAIISTGGGTPCYYDNMDWMLAHGTVLYLHHTAKSLWSRLSKSNPDKRPVLKGLNGAELLLFIEKKLSERHPYYSRSHVIIDQINTPLHQIQAIIHEYRNEQI